MARWLKARATQYRTRADAILETIIAKLPADVPLDVSTAKMPELDLWRGLHSAIEMFDNVADLLLNDF